MADWPSDRVIARRDAGALCHGLIDRLVTARNGDEQASAINEVAARFLHDRAGTLDLTGGSVRPHPAVATACALLDAADDKLPLEDLAQAIDMNHRYVISLFKHSIGVPPHQYVMARRIERARRLLNRGQALNAVAADAGFNDQSHLTHDFKRVFGVTPGAYQARHCEMNFLQKFPRAVA
jgi:AraC-like DNA-binding protein